MSHGFNKKEMLVSSEIFNILDIDQDGIIDGDDLERLLGRSYGEGTCASLTKGLYVLDFLNILWNCIGGFDPSEKIMELLNNIQDRDNTVKVSDLKKHLACSENEKQGENELEEFHGWIRSDHASNQSVDSFKCKGLQFFIK